MAISTYINDTMKSKGAGVIRKMFEEGIKLKAQYGADKVYDFSLGNPDLTPPKKVEKAFKRLASSKEANYHGYMPNAGFDFARQAMADKTSLEQGVNVTKDCIIMEVGAAGAINVLLKAIMNPGMEIVQIIERKRTRNCSQRQWTFLSPCPFFLSFCLHRWIKSNVS